jgi:hypothetical protein
MPDNRAPYHESSPAAPTYNAAFGIGVAPNVVIVIEVVYGLAAHVAVVL